MTTLPTPFEDHIPELLKNNLANDAGGIALVNKADTDIQEWVDDSLELYYLKWPERCPSALLAPFGEYLAAGINAEDTEREKRQKIYYAVQRHKSRSTWIHDAKPIIDGVAGGDSQILDRNGYFNEWINWGQEVSDPDNYTAVMGSDGIDDDLGIDLVGAGDENSINGIVWIDVDNDSLTTDEVQRIINSMDADVTPAYFKVVLGYLDGVTGVFTPYANGTMG